MVYRGLCRDGYRKDSIRTLPVFDLFRDHVAEDEMFRAFNMGVGMVLVVPPESVAAVLAGCDGYEIGEIAQGPRQVIMK